MEILKDDMNLQDIIKLVHRTLNESIELDDGKGNIIMIHAKHGEKLMVLIKNREYAEKCHEDILKKPITNMFMRRYSTRNSLFYELAKEEELIAFEEWMDSWMEEERELYSNQYLGYYDRLYKGDIV